MWKLSCFKRDSDTKLVVRSKAVDLTSAGFTETRKNNGENRDRDEQLRIEGFTVSYPRLDERPVYQATDIVKMSYKICSWNVQKLTETKMQSTAALDAICQFIISEEIDLVAFQEIGSARGLSLIVAKMQEIADESGSNDKWNFISSAVAGKMFQSSEYFGFVFKESRSITAKSGNEFRSKSFTRSPFLSVFDLHGTEIMFINVHLKAFLQTNLVDMERNGQEVMDIATLCEAIGSSCSDYPNVILLGDFNRAPDAPEFDYLRDLNYRSVIVDNTNISGNRLKGSKCLDNIWISTDLFSTVANAGVFRRIVIEEATDQLVSDHCAIFADLVLSK